MVLLRKEQEARINAEARAEEVEAAMRASKDRVAAAESRPLAARGVAEAAVAAV